MQIGVIILLLVGNLWTLGQSFGGAERGVVEEYLKEDPPLGKEVAELKPFKGRRLVIFIERYTDCAAQFLKGKATMKDKWELPVIADEEG